jgi:hypothetical protein
MAGLTNCNHQADFGCSCKQCSNSLGDIVSKMPMPSGYDPAFIKLTPPPIASSEEMLDYTPETSVAVEDKSLMTKAELNEEIDLGSQKHKRKITDLEYDQMVDTYLKGNKAEDVIYSYEKAAIARVIAENYKVYYPDYDLGDDVEKWLDYTLTMSDLLQEDYLEAVDKWRSKFTQVNDITSTTIAPMSQAKRKYIHPMIRYGLIKK